MKNDNQLVTTCEEIAMLADAGQGYAPAVKRLKEILAHDGHSATYMDLVNENQALRRKILDRARFKDEPGLFDNLGLLLLGFLSGVCTAGIFIGLLWRGVL